MPEGGGGVLIDGVKEGWGGGGGGETVVGASGVGITDIPPCPNSAEGAGTGSEKIRIAIIQKTTLVIRYWLQNPSGTVINAPPKGPQIVDDRPAALPSNSGPSSGKALL